MEAPESARQAELAAIVYGRDADDDARATAAAELFALAVADGGCAGPAAAASEPEPAPATAVPSPVAAPGLGHRPQAPDGVSIRRSGRGALARHHSPWTGMAGRAGPSRRDAAGPQAGGIGQTLVAAPVGGAAPVARIVLAALLPFALGAVVGVAGSSGLAGLALVPSPSAPADATADALGAGRLDSALELNARPGLELFQGQPRSVAPAGLDESTFRHARIRLLYADPAERLYGVVAIEDGAPVACLVVGASDGTGIAGTPACRTLTDFIAGAGVALASPSGLRYEWRIDAGLEVSAEASTST